MALPIVNTGLAIWARRLQTQNGESTPAQPEPKYFGWGLGTLAVLTDTSLATPSVEGRVAGTSSIVTTNVANDTYQLVGLIVSNSVQSICELGQFDASSAGNMFAHWTFTAIPLNPGDGIEFTTKSYGI